ncbi:hypothetical protein IAT40_002416 [Kwoniella sp. CBS 6097]
MSLQATEFQPINHPNVKYHQADDVTITYSRLGVLDNPGTVNGNPILGSVDIHNLRLHSIGDNPATHRSDFARLRRRIENDQTYTPIPGCWFSGCATENPTESISQPAGEAGLLCPLDADGEMSSHLQVFGEPGSVHGFHGLSVLEATEEQGESLVSALEAPGELVDFPGVEEDEENPVQSTVAYKGRTTLLVSRAPADVGSTPDVLHICIPDELGGTHNPSDNTYSQRTRISWSTPAASQSATRRGKMRGIFCPFSRSSKRSTR